MLGIIFASFLNIRGTCGKLHTDRRERSLKDSPTAFFLSPWSAKEVLEVPTWCGYLHRAYIAGRMSIHFGLISRTPWVRLPLPRPRTAQPMLMGASATVRSLKQAKVHAFALTGQRVRLLQSGHSLWLYPSADSENCGEVETGLHDT